MENRIHNFYLFSERTDSFSSTSLSIETNKKPTTVVKSVAAPLLQPVSKENRPSTKTNGLTMDKLNANLRESLDELTELSNRMENIMDSEPNK